MATQMKAPSLFRFTSSEDVALQVMSIILEVYGAAPTEFWGLSHSADLLAPRGFVVDERSFRVYNRRFRVRGGYPILNVRFKWWSWSDPLVILAGIKTVRIEVNGFNCEVILCDGVEELTFDPQIVFNRPIELPNGLRKLQFGVGFKRPVVLPSTLKELFFYERSLFNHPIKLPQNLLVAAFGNNFDQPISLPPLLEQLKLGANFDQALDLARLHKLRVLHLSGSFNSPVCLPESMEDVELVGCFNQPVDLPPTLRRIAFGYSFDYSLRVPPRLEELIFDEYGAFNHVLALPENSCMKTLRLSGKFNHPIDLVEGLEHVYFGSFFTCPVHLPSTLRTLEFSRISFFHHPLDLPANLEELTLGPAYAHPLTLPNSLKRITLKEGYGRALVLPPGCERVHY